MSVALTPTIKASHARQRRSAPPWLALAGPAFVVSIGYIDPGNWATDLAAGALATTTTQRRAQLLFHCTVAVSVLVGLAGVTLLFCLSARSLKRLDRALIAIVVLIALAYIYQIRLLSPSLEPIIKGALIPNIPERGALVIIVGMIGATVMPHNLFLHSALIAKACQGLPVAEREQRGRFSARETLVALNVAMLINAGILIVGAALRGADGSIAVAFGGLVPLAGAGAALAFGAALLLSGLAASTTATLSGDYIFEAFSPVRIPTFFRRALTLLPAAAFLLAGANPMNLLNWSQVALALVLPTVIVPIILLTRQTRFNCTPFVARRALALSIAAAVVCIGFDGVLLVQSLS